MGAEMRVRHDGEHKRIKEFHINDAGTWRKIKEMWIKKNGVWRKTYRSALQLAVTEDTNDYDLFTAAGSPTTSLDIILTIDLNVTVGASSTATAALSCSSDFPAGTTLKIINKGRIYGAGGNGGSAGEGGLKQDCPIYPGEAGGPALSLGCNTTIVNASGNIWGGGGGGGARDELSSYNSDNIVLGGGGAGSTPGIGGTGFDKVWGQQAWPGTTSAGGLGKIIYWAYSNDPAYGRTSAQGGGPGAPGASPGFSSASDHKDFRGRITAGGSAGKAIDQNGYTLTWESGLNATQVKGEYS